MTLTTTDIPATSTPELSLLRLHLMRGGYLLMGLGLALVKWPLLPEAHAQPVFEGVVTCLLSAVAVLALLGLRHPVKLLPLLLLEVTWKMVWLTAVALPRYVAGDLDTATRAILVNCSLVVLIIAVTPWRHVWRHYALARGDQWR